MKDRILELAKQAGFTDGDVSVFPKLIERFYQLAHQDGQKQMRERAAVSAWIHYAEICKSEGINPHHYGKWIASNAIRNLEIQNNE